MRKACISLILGVAAASAAPALAGTCTPDWDATLGQTGVIPTGGVNGAFSPFAQSFALWDDGSGEALYIGGTFDSLGGICGTSGIAKWDGATYIPLDNGVTNPFANFTVADMAVFDNGSGPALFAAGTFTTASGVADTAKLAKWDGTQWESVATGLDSFTVSIQSLQVWDDGTGPALYIGGTFTSISGVNANNIVKYDGTTFTPLLNGVSGGGAVVYDMKVFNNKLVVAGRFSSFDNGAMGGVESALNVAQWNGTTWEQIGQFGIDGTGVTSYVNALQVFDDGTGAKMYIGGRNLISPNLSDPGTITSVLVWDGTATADSITESGVALPDTCTAFGVFNDGSGDALFCGRQLSTTDTSTNRIDVLTPSGWVEVGGGADGSVFALLPWDDGSGAGTRLYVAGAFSQVGGQVAGGLATWNGGDVSMTTNWDTTIGNVAAAPTFGIADGAVEAFAVRDFGFQEFMYIGGSFTNIGGLCGSSGIVYWNAQTEQFGTLDQGVTNPNGNFEVLDMAVFDDGTGPALYVAGTFQTASGVPNTSGIAKWNGSSWEAVAEFGFFLDSVRALTVWDDGTGPALYIGGSFSQIRKPGDPSFVTGNGIVKYDGTTFTPLAGGIQPGGIVFALQPFNGKLYVGGYFFNVDNGSVGVQKLAAWDGSAWSRPDNFRLDAARYVFDLATFDDGNGERLYIAGRSLDIITDPNDPLSGTTRTSVAALDGTNNIDALSFDGLVLEDDADALAVYDDGTGPALYVGGTFTTTANHVAKLTPSGWQTVGGGTDNSVYALYNWDDDTGMGPQLYVGGAFANVNNATVAASGAAAFGGCNLPCPCERDGDTAQVNVFDLLAYLTDWFPENGMSGSGLAADYNNSGNVDVFDLLDYLSCWFPASAGNPCP